MQEAFSSWSIAGLVLYLVFGFWPGLSVLLGSCMLIKPLMVVSKANEMLKSGTIFEIPDWINDCSRGDQQLPTENQIRTETIERAASEINSLYICLVTTMVLTSINMLCCLLLPLIIVFCPLLNKK